MSAAVVLQKSYEDQLLDWFSDFAHTTFERSEKLGAFGYHYFETQFIASDGRPCSGHGRSQSRKLAAIKAVAEYAERKFLTEFFLKNPNRLFKTSNGWAVHFDLEKAKVAAQAEALERHLLLKSYLSFGWQGFDLVQTMNTKNMDIYFLKTCFQVGSTVSGIVITKSKKYSGVSFGYCLGKTEDIQTFQFWEPAIYESVDKIFSLKGQQIDLSLDPKSWLLAETKHYLESDFDLNQIQSQNKTIQAVLPEPDIETFNLSQEWGLDFPFYAAYAHGGGLIPLFSTRILSEEERKALLKILEQNDIYKIPERHPIL